MPKETFWDSARAVEGDDSHPIVTIAWGGDEVIVNGIAFDDSGVTRMIETLHRARKQTYRPELEMIPGGAIIEQEPIPDMIRL